VKRLALVLVLAAGVADANVWQRAVDRGSGEAKDDLYEAAMRKADDAARQARSHGASLATIKSTIQRAVDSYRTAAAAKPAEAEPWWRIGMLLHSLYFDCQPDPFGPPPSPLCDARFDEKRAEEVIFAWDEFEKRAPLDPRLTYFAFGGAHVLFERAILHTKLIEHSDPKLMTKHLEAAAADYEKILARMDTGSGETGDAYEQCVGNLAETYMMLDRLDDAIDMYRDAINHGGRGSTVYGYAVALDRDDRGDAAREWVLKQGAAGVRDFHEKYMKGDVFFVPQGEVYYYYALLAEAFDHSEEAIENWQLYIRSGAHPEYQPRAKQHLDALSAKRIKRAIPHLDWNIDL
jgi:tetratricopeptide (TPR) repeat protein